MPLCPLPAAATTLSTPCPAALRRCCWKMGMPGSWSAAAAMTGGQAAAAHLLCVPAWTRIATLARCGWVGCTSELARPYSYPLAAAATPTSPSTAVAPTHTSCCGALCSSGDLCEHLWIKALSCAVVAPAGMPHMPQLALHPPAHRPLQAVAAGPCGARGPRAVLQRVPEQHGAPNQPVR